MTVESSGLLVWRQGATGPEFLLAHPGGPFWTRRDEGAWTIPKGLLDRREDPLAAARREFLEETGLVVDGAFHPLTPLRQPSRKLVHAWLVRADLDLAAFESNSFELEWPRGSGRMRSWPEIDRIAYFPTETALGKLLPGQRPFITEALAILSGQAT